MCFTFAVCANGFQFSSHLTLAPYIFVVVTAYMFKFVGSIFLHFFKLSKLLL